MTKIRIKINAPKIAPEDLATLEELEKKIMIEIAPDLATLEELEKIIREQKGKYQQRAKLAKEIIKKKKIKKIKTEEGGVDDILVKLAKEGMIIVTQDKELKKRIKNANGQVMTIRQKKRIVLV